MSSARANANQSLYLARILIGAWRDALDAADIPASTLDQAFLPAVSAHMRDAYGWFLLEIVGEEPPEQGGPPWRVSDLPERPEGKAESGELRECARMEQAGWLAQMLAGEAAADATPASPGNLAHRPATGAGCAEARDWADSLQAVFERMRDSLEEY